MNTQPEQEEYGFAAATPEMLPCIVRFLADVGLPAEDLSPAKLSGFELAFDRDGRIVGVAGLDVSGCDALLRSVAVLPDWRGKGIGLQLVARRESAARAARVGSIYLLTTTADSFFLRLGYANMPRETVPATVAAHPQFRNLCPASAKCLGKRL